MTLVFHQTISGVVVLRSVNGSSGRRVYGAVSGDDPFKAVHFSMRNGDESPKADAAVQQPPASQHVVSDVAISSLAEHHSLRHEDGAGVGIKSMTWRTRFKWIRVVLKAPHFYLVLGSTLFGVTV